MNYRETGWLIYELPVCIGARVMLTFNIDVSDGLYNGASGEIVGWDFKLNEN